MVLRYCKLRVSMVGYWGWKWNRPETMILGTGQVFDDDRIIPVKLTGNLRPYWIVVQLNLIYFFILTVNFGLNKKGTVIKNCWFYLLFLNIISKLWTKAIKFLNVRIFIPFFQMKKSYKIRKWWFCLNKDNNLLMSGW